MKYRYQTYRIVKKGDEYSHMFHDECCVVDECNDTRVRASNKVISGGNTYDESIAKFHREWAFTGVNRLNGDRE